MSQAGDITRLLQQADEGDADAGGRLFVLVQEDLKAIARKRKKLSAKPDDASTTLLVDEAFMRLVGQDASTWHPGDRRKFFGYAAKNIHEMLIKARRAEQAAKRGGGQKAQDLVGEPAAAEQGDVDLQIDLRDALNRFEAFAPQDALLFRVRYFLGCTFEETAELLGISSTEAKRSYERARLWLAGELKEYQLDA